MEEENNKPMSAEALLKIARVSMYADSEFYRLFVFQETAKACVSDSVTSITREQRNEIHAILFFDNPVKRV